MRIQFLKRIDNCKVLWQNRDDIWNPSYSTLRKEAQMGKSLNGKELGKGLSQRKDGLYQGRFVNRFGKKQTVYAKTLNEVRQKLRNEQYEDEKALNVVAKDTFYYNLYVVAIDTGMYGCNNETNSEGTPGI